MPVSTSYYGAGWSNQNWAITIGEEEHELGSWLAATVNTTDIINPPIKETTVWPSRELPGRYEPVGAVVPQVAGAGVQAEAFILVRVDAPDQEPLPYTVAMLADDSGALRVEWTQQFRSDIGEHYEPVAIAMNTWAQGPERAVIVLAREPAKDGLYWMNIYSPMDGSLVTQFEVPVPEGGAVVDMVGGAVTYITGHAVHPVEQVQSYFTTGVDIETGEVLELWNPTEWMSAPAWVTLPGYELEAVRAVKPRVHYDYPLTITGNAAPVAGGNGKVYTVSVQDSGTPYVRWAEIYDSGGQDVVVADMSVVSDAGIQSEPYGRVWITGTAHGPDGRRRIFAVAYDDEAAGNVHWEALWENEHGNDAEGHRITHIQLYGGTVSSLPQPHPVHVYVAGRTQAEAGANAPWEFVFLSFDDDHLTLPKTRLWEVFDAQPDGYFNQSPIALDVRWLPYQGDWEDSRVHFWFTAPVQSESLGVQWYTAQFARP